MNSDRGIVDHNTHVSEREYPVVEQHPRNQVILDVGKHPELHTHFVRSPEHGRDANVARYNSKTLTGFDENRGRYCTIS